MSITGQLALAVVIVSAAILTSVIIAVTTGGRR